MGVAGMGGARTGAVGTGGTGTGRAGVGGARTGGARTGGMRTGGAGTGGVGAGGTGLAGTGGVGVGGMGSGAAGTGGILPSDSSRDETFLDFFRFFSSSSLSRAPLRISSGQTSIVARPNCYLNLLSNHATQFLRQPTHNHSCPHRKVFWNESHMHPTTRDSTVPIVSVTLGPFLDSRTESLNSSQSVSGTPLNVL
jgi:hypothetical protein